MHDFIEELKRRKVFRAVVAYIIVSWVLIQIAETTFEPMGLPPWSLTFVIALVFLGLPLALVLAWGFDITSSGIERTQSVPEAAESDDIPSIAVLPFVDMSPDKDNEYFADGLTEELLNVLAKAGGMRVSSRTSSFAFKGQNVDIKSVANSLNVAHVVEGSVRKSGNLLRITSQLIEAANDSHLWSETFDRELDDVFAIQDEIATQITRALQVQLTPQALAEPTTVDVHAYDYFLRGRSVFYTFGQSNIWHAIEMYENAIEIDPSYARAWAALAITKASLALLFLAEGDERVAAVNEARAAAMKSAELAPDSADSHLARGMTLMLDKQPEKAEVEFKAAVELEPHMYEGYYQYARAAFILGQMEKAAMLFERAIEVDPGDYRSAQFLTTVYRGLKQTDKLEMAIARAAALIEAHLEKHPDDLRALGLATGAMNDIGRQDKAELYAERALAIDPDNENTLYNVACFYSLSGNLDKALDMLERCKHSGGWMENDSDLDPLRDLPRFKAWAAKFA